MQPLHEVWATFTNERNIDIIFVLEPWGDTYTMPPHTTFKLFLRATIAPSPTKSLEVEYGDTSLTVYAWEGCIASLFHGDKELR